MGRIRQGVIIIGLDSIVLLLLRKGGVINWFSISSSDDTSDMLESTDASDEVAIGTRAVTAFESTCGTRGAAVFEVSSEIDECILECIFET